MISLKLNFIIYFKVSRIHCQASLQTFLNDFKKYKVLCLNLSATLFFMTMAICFLVPPVQFRLKKAVNMLTSYSQVIASCLYAVLPKAVSVKEWLLANNKMLKQWK
ncbi:MAG TPA: hypothetical protein DCW59_02255 [Alteromonas sp.]|nr:hypothetical protein [Alteromonas sp.]